MTKDLSNSQVVHVKKSDGIEYIQFRKLLEYPEIVHCYTLKGERNSNYVCTEENGDFTRLCKHLAIDKEKFVQVKKQVHSDNILEVEDPNQEYTNVDGLVTKQKGVAIALRYADCIPVFLYDPIQQAVGNIHSGWRGTVKKIAQKGIVQMQKCYGSNPKDIICCIGPCIKECHFEVEKDVEEIFQQSFSKNSNVWKESLMEEGIKEGKRKYRIDTTKLIIEMLEKAGVRRENIVDSGLCTVCCANNIHSYRAEKEKAGRNMAIIMLK